jgi:hypothetical protein
MQWPGTRSAENATDSVLACDDLKVIGTGPIPVRDERGTVYTIEELGILPAREGLAPSEKAFRYLGGCLEG